MPKVLIADDLDRKASKIDTTANTLKQEKGSIFQSQQLIIIGASTGGPKVIQDILSKLIPPFPPVIVVQHFPVGFTTPFAERLDKWSELHIIEAKTGMLLTSNHVYIAPAGMHLVLDEDYSNIKIYLCKGDRVNGGIPALEPTLLSASYYFVKRLIVVILTGMGSDGLVGVQYCKANGGLVLVQDEQSSLVYGMPKAVLEAGFVGIVANPVSITSYLNAGFSNKNVTCSQLNLMRNSR
ncbi:MAG: CheB methylesterase domain-containing protein [Promethearchaeota archaeon]